MKASFVSEMWLIATEMPTAAPTEPPPPMATPTPRAPAHARMVGLSIAVRFTAPLA